MRKGLILTRGEHSGAGERSATLVPISASAYWWSWHRHYVWFSSVLFFSSFTLPPSSMKGQPSMGYALLWPPSAVPTPTQSWAVHPVTQPGGLWAASYFSTSVPRQKAMSSITLTHLQCPLELCTVTVLTMLPHTGHNNHCVMLCAAPQPPRKLVSGWWVSGLGRNPWLHLELHSFLTCALRNGSRVSSKTPNGKPKSLTEQTFVENTSHASKALTCIPSLNAKQTIANTEREHLSLLHKNNRKTPGRSGGASNVRDQ